LTEKTAADYESQNAYSAFLGVINILDKVFLLMVKDVHRVGKLEEASIYQISTIIFVSLEVTHILKKKNITLK